MPGPGLGAHPRAWRRRPTRLGAGPPCPATGDAGGVGGPPHLVAPRRLDGAWDSARHYFFFFFRLPLADL